MQDPATYQQIKPHFPEQEQLKCPRCDSTNTKFCYYNNYNMSQPRHFCKNCRRYWTKGGALRNIPVGGGSRKNTKRSTYSKRQATSAPDSDATRIRKLSEPSQTSASASATAATAAPPRSPALNSGVQNQSTCSDPDPTRLLDIGGSFSSLLASNGQFGSLLEGLNPSGSGLKTVQMGDFGRSLETGRGLVPGSGQDPGLDGSSNNGESYLGVQSGDSSCWSGASNGWPDLAIYTPGSSFQ